MARRGVQKSAQGESGNPGRPVDPGTPFVEKVGEVVGKVVPEHLLATVFAGTAILAFVLLILAIIGFVRDPGDVAKGDIADRDAKIEGLVEDLEEERDAHAQTRGEKKDIERKVGSSGNDLERAQAVATRLDEELGELKPRLEGLRKDLKEANGKVAELRKAQKVAQALAAREKKTVEKEAKGASGKLEDTSKRLAKADLEIAAWKERYEETRKEKSKADETYEHAELAYKTIVEAVTGIDTPEKKIETIEKMRASEAAMSVLQGSPFSRKLDVMIAAERKNARREAKATYAEYMDKLEMATDHGAALALLAEAKKEFDERGETSYALKVDRKTTDRKDQIAREVSDEVMKSVRAEPEAYEENIGRLKEALEKVKGTRWKEAIEEQIVAREKTLPDDIARVLYEKLVSKSRLNPDKHDENIAYAEEVKSRITKRYEKKYAKQVIALKRARTEVKGRKALAEARELIAKNPENHQGNIEGLGDLLKDAEGSSSVAKLMALLQRERKLLARAKK